MDVIQRGQAAERLLTDPLVAEALTELEDLFVQLWKDAPDSVQREEIWYTQKGLTRLMQKLDSFRQDGRLAEQEIENGS